MRDLGKQNPTLTQKEKKPCKIRIWNKTQQNKKKQAKRKQNKIDKVQQKQSDINKKKKRKKIKQSKSSTTNAVKGFRFGSCNRLVFMSGLRQIKAAPSLKLKTKD